MLSIPLSPQGPLRELSPDAPTPIEVNGERWPTATQFVLAGRYFFDEEHREAIRRAATPDDARALARRPSRYDWKGERTGTPADPHMYWKGSRFNVIRRAVHERAVGDPRFVASLRATAPHELALDCDEPALGRPEDGWGRMLVELRGRLERADIDALRRWKLPEWLQYPEIPRGSIGWRMGYGEAYAYELFDWVRALDGAERRRYEATYGPWPAD